MAESNLSVIEQADMIIEEKIKLLRRTDIGQLSNDINHMVRQYLVNPEIPFVLPVSQQNSPIPMEVAQMVNVEQADVPPQVVELVRVLPCQRQRRQGQQVAPRQQRVRRQPRQAPRQAQQPIPPGVNDNDIVEIVELPVYSPSHSENGTIVIDDDSDNDNNNDNHGNMNKDQENEEQEEVQQPRYYPPYGHNCRQCWQRRNCAVPSYLSLEEQLRRMQ